MQHTVKALGQLVCLGDLIGNVGIADLGLGAHDALRQSGSRGQKGAGNLFGSETADFTQRQGKLRFGGEARVTAGEDQAQAVILDQRFLGFFRRQFGLQPFGDLFVGHIKARFASQLVDGLEAAGGYQPGTGVTGDTVFWPLHQCRRKGVVQTFFSQVKITEQPNQAGKHPARFRLIKLIQPDLGYDGHGRARYYWRFGTNSCFHVIIM